MDEIFALLGAQNLVSVWDTVNGERQAYLGERLFGTKKQYELTLTTIKGARGLPIALKPSQFDAKATIRPRINIESLAAEIPFFRESYKLTEKDRRNLLAFRAAAPSLYADTLENVYDDVNNLIFGALAVNEAMRWQVLTTMTIVISSNEANYDYDFDPDGSWKATNYLELTGTSAWNIANKDTATPIEDIKTAVETISNETGEVITTMIMNTVTLNKLRNMTQIKDAILNGYPGYIGTASIATFLMDEFGLTLEINDKKYQKTNADGTLSTVKFLEDDYVVFIPAGQLGDTVFSYTPEEIDAANLQLNGATVAVVETGITISSIVHNHPVTSEVIASQLCLPSLSKADSVFVIKVDNN